jgi:predicted RNA-binding Zn ribbon-like protein
VSGTGARSVDTLPDWELVFRFASGRLCLAFCATVGERWRRGFERLRNPGDLSRWLSEAGLAGSGSGTVSQALLRDARELREASYRLVRAAMAGEPGDPADRERVNRWARRTPVLSQLGPANQRQSWTGSDSARAGLASVAADAVDLLSRAAIYRVRECSAGDCALLFLDSSRPGKRRWCADGACGSKARSASYRARRAQSQWLVT